jgi:hypothetical protein
MKKCSVCKEKTENVFNIKFKAVPICEECAKSIALQQAHWYTQQTSLKEINESPKCVCTRLMEIAY